MKAIFLLSAAILAYAVIYVALMPAEITVDGEASLVLTVIEELKVWQTLIAGLVGLGGIALVNAQAVHQTAEHRQTARNAMVAAIAVEVDQIRAELSTICKLLESDDGQQRQLGLRKIKTIPDNKLFYENLEQSLVVPTGFIIPVLDFFFHKKDVRERYGHAENPEEKRILAAILLCIEAGDAVIAKAVELVPELKVQLAST